MMITMNLENFLMKNMINVVEVDNTEENQEIIAELDYFLGRTNIRDCLAFFGAVYKVSELYRNDERIKYRLEVI